MDVCEGSEVANSNDRSGPASAGQKVSQPRGGLALSRHWPIAQPMENRAISGTACSSPRAVEPLVYSLEGIY